MERAMDNQGFGKYLRLLRVNAGLTMVEVSKSTGITQGYISQIENEVHKASASTLNKLAKAYGISPITIMKRAGIISEGHARIPESSLQEHRLKPGLPRGDLEKLLRRSLNSIGELSREVETLRRIEEVRKAQDDGLRPADDLRVPVLGANLETVFLPQAPEGMITVPGTLLSAREEGVAMQVSGDEMLPELRHGDIVLVERKRWPEQQGIAAVRTAEGVAFMTLTVLDGAQVLTAANPDYSHLNMLLPPERKHIVLGQAVALVWRQLAHSGL
jgi:transcriptional regulator with XRE-family HTH domain